MSAIAGLYRRDGRPVDAGDVKPMIECLAHRGPGASGAWNGGPVGLAHRMLWTTPESVRERLPLTNGTGDVVITADARVDNRDELIAALGLEGGPNADISDSGLILSAFERWGQACPGKLLGDFAFAHTMPSSNWSATGMVLGLGITCSGSTAERVHISASAPSSPTACQFTDCGDLIRFGRSWICPGWSKMIGMTVPRSRILG